MNVFASRSVPIGSLRVLRHREFATVWAGVLMSDIGTWMQIAALGIFAVQVTGHAKWVGILTTVTYVSAGLLAPLGGVAADRHDRRLTVALAVSVQAIVAIPCWRHRSSRSSPSWRSSSSGARPLIPPTCSRRRESAVQSACSASRH